MRRRKRNLWTMEIVIRSMLLLLVFLWWPLPAAHGHAAVASGSPLPGTVTVQATPTEDATVTALSKEQLTQQVVQQQHTWDNWFWSNAAAILSSFLSTLVIVIGALFGLWRWRADRKDTQDKELKERQIELEKRAEERFQAAVIGLGDEKEGVKIGAAILLRTFLRPGYEQFYTQTFDLTVAHLRRRRTSQPEVDPDTPLPLTTLSQALIVAFKEAFPRARRQYQDNPQALDATGVQLDNAYLRGADLKQIWMPEASLPKTNLMNADLDGAFLNDTNFSESFLNFSHLHQAFLNRANLSGANLFEADLSEAKFGRANLTGARLDQANLSAANLSWANLSRANLSAANLDQAILSWTNIEDAQSLKETNLHGVIGLTKEQLALCKAKGAIVDEDSTTSTSVAPPLQNNGIQASAAPSAQGSVPMSDTNVNRTLPSSPGDQQV